MPFKKNKLFLLHLGCLVAIITLMSACNKNDEEVLFRLPVRNQLFTIGAGISTFESQFYIMGDVVTNMDSLLSQFNISEANIQRIVPATARVTALFSGVDYNFIREISVKICSIDEATRLRSGEALECGREIFWRNPVPEQAPNFLDLVPNENDLKDLLLEPNTTFQVKLVSPLRRTTTQFIESRLEMTFDVR